MKILIVGGSFNPVHLGHVLIAQEVRLEFGYDIALFIPSFQAPHKRNFEDPGPEHRANMIRIALADDETLQLETCELERGGTSYTMDTIHSIIAERKVEGKPGLLIGADLVSGFSTWKSPEIIAQETDLICARRGTHSIAALGYPHRQARNPVIEISSTLIRTRIANKDPFRAFLHPGVFEYISAHGLYGI